MFDCFLAATLAQELSSHVHTAVKFADRFHKALNCIFKLFSLTLGDSEVVPDTRIRGGEFSSALQVFLRSFEIAGFEEEGSRSYSDTAHCFCQHDRSLKGLKRTIVHALAAIGNTQEILDLGRLWIG